MSEPTRGLLDTSVVVDHDVVDPDMLPDESAISAITLAELAAGPHATNDDEERTRATIPGVTVNALLVRFVRM